MQERSRVWKGIGAGMLTSLYAYKMYILPLASFLVQLEDLPPQWKDIERNIMNTLFPGARGWICPALMQHLKPLGFSPEFPDAVAMASGAKCRIYKWENMCNGGLRLRRRLRHLTQVVSSTQSLDRLKAWPYWVNNNFFSQVVRVQQQLEETAAAARGSVDMLVQGQAANSTPKKLWQKRCSELLRVRNLQGIARHLRTRLDRWQLHVLPGYRVHRMEDSLRRLGPLVPPCVWAAAFKAMLGGWTTGDARLAPAGCLFGCESGQDSIPHYAFRPHIHRLSRTRLRLQPVVAERRVDDFLLLDARGCTDADERLALCALRLYATFIATNARRYGTVVDASEAWIQAMMKGVSGSSPLARIMGHVWSQ